MKVRVASGARRQMERVFDYISESSPIGARRVRDRITEVLVVLREHPLAGQATENPGVRRLVINPFPYLLFYRVVREEIVILRFRHAARRERSD